MHECIVVKSVVFTVKMRPLISRVCLIVMDVLLSFLDSCSQYIVMLNVSMESGFREFVMSTPKTYSS